MYGAWSMKKSLCLFCVIVFSLVSHAQDSLRSIHVMVALCDNEHQGIVPVPKQLGNGDDPRNNLYWGALYGTKTFLKKSPNWRLEKATKNPAKGILERAVFSHKTRKAFIVADAYKGAEIKKALQDFFAAAAETTSGTVEVGKHSVGISGKADLIVYIGHNGLMDFALKKVAKEKAAKEKGASPKAAMVLACKSKAYFHGRLTELGCTPALLTTGYMAPEAYTLEAAVESWLSKESAEKIRAAAARTYHKYQKCGLKGAMRLFYSGK